MDGQDWTPVTLRRRYTKKDAPPSERVITSRDSERSEKQRLAKLDNMDGAEPIVKKKVAPSAIQELIRKRIELKLTQDKADAMCSFPKHTFRELEAGRLLPSANHLRSIQQNFSVALKIMTTSS